MPLLLDKPEREHQKHGTKCIIVFMDDPIMDQMKNHIITNNILKALEHITHLNT